MMSRLSRGACVVTAHSTVSTELTSRARSDRRTASLSEPRYRGRTWRLSSEKMAPYESPVACAWNLWWQSGLPVGGSGEVHSCIAHNSRPRRVDRPTRNQDRDRDRSSPARAAAAAYRILETATRRSARRTEDDAGARERKGDIRVAVHVNTPAPRSWMRPCCQVTGSTRAARVSRRAACSSPPSRRSSQWRTRHHGPPSRRT